MSAQSIDIGELIRQLTPLEDALQQAFESVVREHAWELLRDSAQLEDGGFVHVPDSMKRRDDASSRRAFTERSEGLTKSPGGNAQHFPRRERAGPRARSFSEPLLLVFYPTVFGGLILPAMIWAFILLIWVSQAFGILAFALILPSATPPFFRLKTRLPPRS